MSRKHDIAILLVAMKRVALKPTFWAQMLSEGPILPFSDYQMSMIYPELTDLTALPSNWEVAWVTSNCATAGTLQAHSIALAGCQLFDPHWTAHVARPGERLNAAPDMWTV